MINAPQETTFAVLTDPAAIEEWWGYPADFPGGIAQGEAGTFEWIGHGLMPMRVERFEPPHRLDLLWGQLGDEVPGDDASLVQFTVVAVGQGRSLVTVVEHGFDEPDAAKRRAAMEQNVQGWIAVLDSLARYVEGRRAQGQEVG